MITEFMGASVETVGKTTAAAIAFEKILGSMPLIRYTDTQGIISFTPQQAEAFRDYVRAKAKATGAPPEVKIDLIPALLPLALEKGLPIVGGIFLLGFILGSTGKKRRKK